MVGRPWLSPLPQSALTSRPDQAQIQMLGERRQRISTSFETQLQLFCQVVGAEGHPFVMPDWGNINRELKRSGVTLRLLWEEYRACHLPPIASITARG